MGILSWLAGSSPATVTAEGVKGAVEGVLSGAGKFAQDVRSAITGEMTPEQKADLLKRSEEQVAAAQQAQVDVNKVEAASRSFFVAGWRPYIGWICGTALGMYFIPQYALAAVLWVKLCWAAGTIQAFPIPEPAGLTQLVVAMLGLGGLRTLEKKIGVTQ